VARSRTAASHWSEPLSLGVSFEDWVDTAPRSWIQPSTTARHLSTNTSATYYRWRFGSGPLQYRVLTSPGGAVAARVRRRGSALELVEAMAFGDQASTAGTESDAIRKSAATHALRIRRGSTRGLWISVPFGPRLMWRD